MIGPGLAATTPRFTHDSIEEHFFMTEISLSQQTCPIGKKNDPKDMGRHSLVSEPRFINTWSGIFDTRNIA